MGVREPPLAEEIADGRIACGVDQTPRFYHPPDRKAGEDRGNSADVILVCVREGEHVDPPDPERPQRRRHDPLAHVEVAKRRPAPVHQQRPAVREPTSEQSP